MGRATHAAPVNGETVPNKAERLPAARGLNIWATPFHLIIAEFWKGSEGSRRPVNVCGRSVNILFQIKRVFAQNTLTIQNTSQGLKIHHVHWTAKLITINLPAPQADIVSFHGDVAYETCSGDPTLKICAQIHVNNTHTWNTPKLRKKPFRLTLQSRKTCIW